MTSSAEAAVLVANQSFYDAFAARDAGAMANVWAREHIVLCVHPGWAPLHGRDAVIGSWRAILGSSESPDIAATDAAVVLLGDAALVTCLEHVADAKLAATNVFVLEQGEWRLVHHHAGPMSPTSGARRADTGPLN
jgi:ketosteroid isomerase-like protein